MVLFYVVFWVFSVVRAKMGKKGDKTREENLHAYIIIRNERARTYAHMYYVIMYNV